MSDEARRRRGFGGPEDAGERDGLMSAGRRPGASKRSCCRRCMWRLSIVLLLACASFLFALHFDVVVYNRGDKFWWPFSWNEKYRFGSDNRWDEWSKEQEAWKDAEHARLSLLQESLGNVTERLHVVEAGNVELRGNLTDVQQKLDKLAKQAYSDSPDLSLRQEVQSGFDRIDSENAARDLAFANAKRDFELRLNETAEQERRDARQQTASLLAQATAEKAYADQRASEVQADVDKRMNEVYATLGDYKETTQVRFDSERDLIYHWIAGTFTLLCFLISLSGVYSHTRALAVPDVQRKILALLWMPPIYSVCCWLSLLYPSSGAGLAMVRDGYEAYTIWVFVSFLISVLGDRKEQPRHLRSSLNATARDAMTTATPRSPAAAERGHKDDIALSDEAETSYSRVVAKLETSKDEHSLPRAFCPPCSRTSARSFLKQCMIATMQFVFLKPTIAVADYVLQAATQQEDFTEAYGNDDSPQAVYIANIRLALFVLDNLSVTVAFSGLLKVYHAVQHHLASHNPWPKFCSVKGIVFITYWQGTVIWAMTRYSGSIANKEVADAVQNFLICIEMFVASVVHSYTFAADEWQPNYVPPTIRMSDNLAVKDFLADWKYVFKSSGQKSQESPQQHESLPLLPVVQTITENPQKVKELLEEARDHQADHQEERKDEEKQADTNEVGRDGDEEAAMDYPPSPKEEGASSPREESGDNAADSSTKAESLKSGANAA